MQRTHDEEVYCWQHLQQKQLSARARLRPDVLSLSGLAGPARPPSPGQKLG